MTTRSSTTQSGSRYDDDGVCGDDEHGSDGGLWNDSGAKYGFAVEKFPHELDGLAWRRFG